MSKTKMYFFRKVSNKSYSFNLPDNKSEILLNINTSENIIEVTSRIYIKKRGTTNINKSSKTNKTFFDMDRLKRSYPNMILDDESNKVEQNKYKRMVTIYSHLVLNDILATLDDNFVKCVLNDDMFRKVLYDIGKIIDVLIFECLLKDMNDSYFKSIRYLITSSQYEQYLSETNRGLYKIIPVDGNIKNANASNLMLVSNFDLYSYDEVFNRTVNNYSKEHIKSVCSSQHSGEMILL